MARTSSQRKFEEALFMIKRFSVIAACFCFAFTFVLFSSGALSDSLWDKDSASPYTTQGNFKVGDIVNILILESSSAIHQAGTDTAVKDDLGLRFTSTVQGLAGGGPRTEFGVKGENKYRGTGQTTRTSNIQARVAAIVTKVLPNGNLAILGRHTIVVNKESQEISITGIIRPIDVSLSNTIYSYQVAEANIVVQGEGAVAEAENPGWFTRIVNWLF
jgi:flagellar L-ring protein precursor FlgH